MKKYISIFLFSIIVFSLSVQSQPMIQTNTISIVHFDRDGSQIINPSIVKDRGTIEIFIELDGDVESEKGYTTYQMDDFFYQSFIEDEEMILANVKEVSPPKGYLSALRKEVYFLKANKNLGSHVSLAPDAPISWDREKYPYFSVVFINERDSQSEIETESFWYRFGGGAGWEGNTPAKPNFSKINAVRVGEYFWMENNFNLYDPYITNSIYPQDPIEKWMFANYFKTLLISPKTNYEDLYPVEPADFDKSYGYYFEQWGTYRLHVFGIFANNESGTELNHANGLKIKDQWRLPYYEDVRQLYAMSPFLNSVSGDEGHITLNERDIRRTLGAKTGDNLCAFDFTDPYNPQVTRSYWFGGANNIYKFNLMPSGWRSIVYNDWFYNGLPSGEPDNRWWMPARGSIAQLFYTVYTPVGTKAYPQLPGDVVTLAEHVSSGENIHKSWKRFPFRWMRALTDAELGYKLYVKIKGLDQNSNEWTSLKGGNEIPLLIAIRNNVVDAKNVDIQKRNLTDLTGIDASYIELPKGYLRGFYVQYIINGNNSRTVDQVATYASKVEDSALGYVANWQKKTKLAQTLSVQEKVNTIVLYPNPVIDILNISTIAGIKSIKIASLSTGRLYVTVANPTSTTIDVSSLPSGTYVVYIDTENGIENHKIVKK